LQYPKLRVRMYLDIQRKPGDTSAVASTIKAT
jgi:hypothetical protein